MIVRYLLVFVGVLLLAQVCLRAADTENSLPVDNVNRLLSKAYWIWDTLDTTSSDLKPQRVFTREFAIDGEVAQAVCRVTAESSYTLLVNGKTVGSGDKVLVLHSYDLQPFLVAGKNRIELDTTSKNWYAGAFFIGQVTTKAGTTVTLMSDDSWDVRVGDDPTVKKAEKVVQGVNGGWWNNCDRLMQMPAPFYHLNTEVPAPCIPWAKTYPGGKLRVLAIHPRGNQWDTVELAHRSDMDITFIPSDYRTVNNQEARRQGRRFSPTIKMRGSRMSSPRCKPAWRAPMT